MRQPVIRDAEHETSAIGVCERGRFVREVVTARRRHLAAFEADLLQFEVAVLAEANGFPKTRRVNAHGPSDRTGATSGLLLGYHVSMQGRFLPPRGAGGGEDRSAAMIQSREAAGSITSSISK